MSWTALCNLRYGQVCCWQCVLSKWPSFQREKTNNSWLFPTPAAPTEVSSQVILTHYSKTRAWTHKSNSPKQSNWNPAVKDSFGDKRSTVLYYASQRLGVKPTKGFVYFSVKHPEALLSEWLQPLWILHLCSCLLRHAEHTVRLGAALPTARGDAARTTQCKVPQKEVKLQRCVCSRLLGVLHGKVACS